MKTLADHHFRVLLVLLHFIGSSAWADEPPKDPGIYEQVKTTESGTSLRYTISIPESFSSDQPAPLILALHYGGQVTPFYGKGLLIQLIEPALLDLGAIIVAPDCPGAGWANKTSESAVMALLNRIMKNYKIDNKRVLVTGYSMGGVGTWYFAARYSQVFSAAIPVSGVPPPETIAMIKDIPVYVIHSPQDEVFPIGQTEKAVAKLKSKGVSARLVAIEGIGHYQIPRFVESLRAAIPWIKQVWGN